MRGITAAILGFLGMLLLKARDRLQPELASPDKLEACERFTSAVQAIRRANETYSEEEIARDVEQAIHEVREARRAASSR